MKSIRYQFTQEALPSPQPKQWGTDYPSSHLHTNTDPQLLFTLIEKPHFYQGYMNGYRQPVVMLKIQTTPHRLDLAQMKQALTYYFKTDFNVSCTQELCYLLGEAVCALQRAAGFPILQDIEVQALNAHEGVFAIWIPTLIEDVFHQAMAFMLQFFYQQLAQSHFIPNEGLNFEIQELITRLKVQAPRGSNSLRLIKAAHLLDIPWCHIAQFTYQFGQGAHSRWFDSTFTDKTSILSAELAKDKQYTWQLWKKAGLPVPQQIVIHSQRQAISQANELGYPVVIKPRNQEGGSGVFAHITCEEKLKKAYEHVQKFSNAILMEEHVKGKDYRLLLLNGKLIWAIERIPAGVTGDGINSIKSLIDIMNQQPNRGTLKSAALKRIEINEIMVDFLAEQNCSLDSILPCGQFIALSRTANISAGGTPVAVFDKVHPDNKHLVETAAKLLRLDFAGIDFICPNIEESYLKVGGALLEINAQPQLGIITTPHIHQQVLSSLIPDKGRIPIIVICGKHPQAFPLQKLIDCLMNNYEHVGLVQDNMAFINNEKMCASPSVFNAANALLLNQQLNSLVYHIQTLDDFSLQGLPFDQCNVILCLESHFAHMPTLVKACSKPLIILENNDLSFEEIINNVLSHIKDKVTAT